VNGDSSLPSVAQNDTWRISIDFSHTPIHDCFLFHQSSTATYGQRDQNGAQELTPPGQAILMRGAETLTVMSPCLPDLHRHIYCARKRPHPYLCELPPS
jgi:hypothetical protein